MENYFGYDLLTDKLGDREIKIVFPKAGTENGKWVLKTEYFEAFPEVELALVAKGYHIAHISNITRWHVPEDTDARAALAEHMHTKYGLNKKCVVIGLSCGGMQGIYFAAKYPQYVSCLYLDAPVVNFLSCPAALGKGSGSNYKEFIQHTGMDQVKLLSYRNHPFDNIHHLVENKIPLVLVCGDSDRRVPYDENGIFLTEAYQKSGCPCLTILKEGCDHHPHGLDDTTPILNFILEHDK